MNSPPPILRLQSVGKTYPTPAGPLQVLANVSLEIHPGEFIGLTGPSGSGKTTLLNIAALLDPPSQGSVAFGGHDVTTLTETDRNRLRAGRIGMVFQNFHLLGRRTVLENVVFRFRYCRPPPATARARARALDALRLVGLDGHAHQPARLLSGGEMQRVAIARALATEPELLLIDEPTGNLDSATATRIMHLFHDLNRRGITMAMVTHQPALIRNCSRHLHCENGSLRERAP